jgi:hypothetical protein
MITTILKRINSWVLVATAVVLLSVVPQIHFWYVRGAEWNGGYAAIQGDEFLYSAYLNSLIDGRPRRNDPFAGRDGALKSPLPESTFSIQFIPSYIMAGLARVTGASAATAFIALSGVAGLLSGMTIFWLLAAITGDRQLSAVGVMFVLCMGALAGGQGLLGLVVKPGVALLGLPFLRRYQPAAVFPLFFVFCALCWRAFSSGRKRPARIYAMLAGLITALLVFSYLYLWTAAVAWLLCVATLWFILQPGPTRQRAPVLFALIAIVPTFTLLPYVYLLSHRAGNLDEAQTLIFTHRPDLFRVPEIIGTLILVTLFLGQKRGRVLRSDPRLIFAAAFAVLPLLLFNQQLVTGRSIQPYHFESFIANYAVLVGLVIMTGLFCPSFTRRRLVLIGVLCFVWGGFEVSMAIVANYKGNVAADQMVPVLLRLKQLSLEDGTIPSLLDDSRTSPIVFSPERDVMGMLPTWTSQGTLLDMGGLDFGRATFQQRKELLYEYLYYSAIDASGLQKILYGTVNDDLLTHYARIAIFGHERVVPMLSFDFKPIQPSEIDEEVNIYRAFADSFSSDSAALHPLAYVITRRELDWSHIDRWYERNGGERFGDYSLYRVKLRNERQHGPDQGKASEPGVHW